MKAASAVFFLRGFTTALWYNECVRGGYIMPRKTFWILVLIGVLVMLSMVVASSAINVGERLRQVHRYAEIGFYIIAFLLVYLLVLNPLRVIFLAPSFSIAIEATDKQANRAYVKAARNLLRMDTLTDTDRQRLRDALNDESRLPDALKNVYQGTVRKQIDRIIVKHSKTVLMTTAISQNGNLDMLAVIMSNIRMLKAIVEACGFRPSYVDLGKLGLNVAVTAMIAEGLEDVRFHEIMPSKFGEAITDVPFLRTATNSVFQGVANGMLTCRIGIVTRRYLFRDNRLMTVQEIRIAAFKEAFRLMPRVITEGLYGFPKGVITLVLKPFRKDPFTAKGEATT